MKKIFTLLTLALIVSLGGCCKDDDPDILDAEDKQEESVTGEEENESSSLTFYLAGEELTDLSQTIDLVEGDLTYTVTGSGDVSAGILEGEDWSATAADGTIAIMTVIGEVALLEVTLTANDEVVATYQLTVTQSGLRGTGTEDDPYQVSSKNILKYLEEQTEANNYFSGVYFAMTNDIDLNGGEIRISRFDGIFDGKGYTITGLTINQSETSNVGLIGTLASGGKVQNLTLENIDITGSSSVGGVVGANKSTVIACYHISGSVYGSAYVGGVLGRSHGGTLTACYWSGYDGSGCGSLSDATAVTTKVDGDTVTWSDAVTGMNSTLQSSDWKYELIGELPTLTKNE